MRGSGREKEGGLLELKDGEMFGGGIRGDYNHNKEGRSSAGYPGHDHGGIARERHNILVTPCRGADSVFYDICHGSA